MNMLANAHILGSRIDTVPLSEHTSHTERGNPIRFEQDCLPKTELRDTPTPWHADC